MGFMYNELERLRDNAPLQLLLGHYAEVGVGAPGEWQDRVMDLPGVEPRQLSRLHGELIAHDWVEQDAYRAAAAGELVRTRYRVTEKGLQASKQVLCDQRGDDVIAGMTARAVARKAVLAEKRSRRRKKPADPKP